MKIAGETQLAAPREQVWAKLLDPDVLAQTIPGCQELVPLGDDEYEMKMKLVVSAVQGLFNGKVKLSGQKPPESYALGVEGSGKIGHVRGGGRFELEEADGGAATLVRYAGEVKVGGKIASVGQRLMDMTAKMMIKRFFSSLSKLL